MEKPLVNRKNAPGRRIGDAPAGSVQRGLTAKRVTKKIMNLRIVYRLIHSVPHYGIAFSVLMALSLSPADAAKVALDPGQWGHPAGEACVSCHLKASSGLAAQWQASAHQRAGVNCMDCH
ncbi:MAG: hypothetical protein JZU52_00205, partial [Lamprocystis purpurea]|nr:hypothetical protein [Lamprocystis purpurea]